MANSKCAILRQLEQDYEKACNGWVLELARLWGIGGTVLGDWIGGEVGGVWRTYDGEWTLSMKDICYAIRKGVSREQAEDWREYSFWAADNGFCQPTLAEFVEYTVPILDEEARRRIEAKKQELAAMKADLELLCEEERFKARTQFDKDTEGKREK